MEKLEFLTKIIWRTRWPNIILHKYTKFYIVVSHSDVLWALICQLRICHGKWKGSPCSWHKPSLTILLRLSVSWKWACEQEETKKLPLRRPYVGAYGNAQQMIVWDYPVWPTRAPSHESAIFFIPFDSLCLCISLSHSVSLCLPLCVSLCLTLFLSVSLRLCLTLFLYVSHCLSLSVSLCCSLFSLVLSLFLAVSHCVCMYACMCMYVCMIFFGKLLST